jgi:hypothetical protein
MKIKICKRGYPISFVPKSISALHHPTVQSEIGSSALLPGTEEIGVGEIGCPSPQRSCTQSQNFTGPASEFGSYLASSKYL